MKGEESTDIGMWYYMRSIKKKALDTVDISQTILYIIYASVDVVHAILLLSKSSLRYHCSVR